MYYNSYYQDEEFYNNLKKREEKKQIKDISVFIGLTFLIVTGVMLVWVVPFIIGAMRFGFSYTEAMQILEEPAVQQTVQIVLSSLVFTLPFLIIIAKSGLPKKEVMRFGKPEKGLFLPMVLLGLGITAFANIGANSVSTFFSFFEIELSAPELTKPEGIFGFILMTIAMAIVPALVEEFALRGAVMGALRKFGDGFAIIASSIVFGLMHGNLVQIPFAFVVGLGIGYAVIKTNSVWTGVLIHFVNNFVSLVLDELMGLTESVFVQNTIGTMYYAICLFCFFIGILIMKKKRGSDFSLQKSDMKLSTAGKVSAFLSTAPMIIFIVIAGLECLLYL